MEPVSVGLGYHYFLSLAYSPKFELGFLNPPLIKVYRGVTSKDQNYLQTLATNQRLRKDLFV